MKETIEWTKEVAEWTKEVAEWTKEVAEWTKEVAEWTNEVAEWTKVTEYARLHIIEDIQRETLKLKPKKLPSNKYALF